MLWTFSIEEASKLLNGGPYSGWGGGSLYKTEPTRIIKGIHVDALTCCLICILLCDLHAGV